MVRLSRALACLGLLALTLALPAPAPLSPSAAGAVVGDCTPGADWGTSRADYASRVADLVNAHRATKGLSALKVSPTLTNSAVWKARHMSEYRYMQHNDPAPPIARTVAQRLEACAYPTSAGWGENIAYGYSTPEAVMQAWLNSAGHRANIENASFKVIGVGAAAADGTGTLYWAQNFGTFDDSGSPTPPPPAPAPTTVTAYPSSTTIQVGALKSGDASRLKADDDSYFQVTANSTSHRTSWYGRVKLVPNTLRNLKVTYKGKNSASCSQTVSIWNWTTGVWTQFDSRTVGTTEVEVSVVPGGTLADYVSGSSGDGDVAVRVRCTRSDSVSFYASGDLMKIAYEKP